MCDATNGRKTKDAPQLLDDAEVERQMELKRAEIQAYRQSRNETNDRRERDRKLRNTLKALQFKLYEQMQVCCSLITWLGCVVVAALHRVRKKEATLFSTINLASLGGFS